MLTLISGLAKPALIPVVLAIALLPCRFANAQTPAWTLAGYATADGGGSWRYVVDVPQDLVATGLTYIRVTSGACGAAPDQALVFETRLQATQAGNMSWEGKLTPTGAPALALTGFDSSSGDVQLIPSGTSTRIDTGLDGVTPGVTLTVCLRQP